jgi:1,4-alpha-glucan branching enzyme
VLAFRRWQGSKELLIVASLNNTSFTDGYVIQNVPTSDGQWREIFNSDSTAYGGSGIANPGLIPSAGGIFAVRVPANSVLVFQRETI